MRSPPLLALTLVVLGSCARTASEGAPVVSDPAEKPLPSTPSTPSPPPTKVVDARVCEPPISCGIWGDCFFFEPLGGDRYRGVDGAVKGAVYRRYSSCYPADAGPAGCARYCAGAGGAPPCVDGLHAELEVCTASAAPRPAAFRCEVRDGSCQRAP